LLHIYAKDCYFPTINKEFKVKTSESKKTIVKASENQKTIAEEKEK